MFTLIQDEHDSNESEDIHSDENDKFEGYKINTYRKLDVIIEETSEELLSLLSSKTEFNYNKEDVKSDKMPIRSMSLINLNSSSKLTTDLIHSKASKTLSNFDVQYEGKSNENVRLISSNIEFNYNKEDVKTDKMPIRSMSLTNLNSPGKSSPEKIHSKATKTLSNFDVLYEGKSNENVSLISSNLEFNYNEVDVKSDDMPIRTMSLMSSNRSSKSSTDLTHSEASKTFSNSDVQFEDKSDENVSVISSNNDFNYTEVDLKNDEMSMKMSPKNFNYLGKSSQDTIHSNSTAISQICKTVSVQPHESEHVISKNIDEEISSKPCMCFSWCFPFNMFQRIKRRYR